MPGRRLDAGEYDPLVATPEHTVSRQESSRMKNVVLTGFMGTGKTDVGRLLATRLGFAFLDCDGEIERQYGMTVSDIFARFGEDSFREREAAVIARLSEREHVVIATGGGAVLRSDNRAHLRKKGVIVCLTASAETILRRTETTYHRPLLNVPNPLDRIRELIETRRPYYEDADIIIDTEGKSPAEVAEEILDGLKGLDGR